MRIVVGVDGSGASEEALRFAAAEADATGAELEAVTVWELPEAAISHVSQEQVDEAMGPWLDGFLTEVLGDRGAGVTRTLRGGSASSALLTIAEGADQLVVGTGGHQGLAAVVMGSVSHQLANHSPCPLTVIPDRAEGDSAEDDSAEEAGDDDLATNADGPIVVGVDGSPHADAALSWAAERASRTGLTLRVVLAWHGEASGWIAGTEVGSSLPEVSQLEAEAYDMLNELVTKAELPSSVQPELVLGEGAPSAVIREAAEGASMLVLGARGRGGFMGLLLGSVTSNMLNDISCATTVIPTD